MTVQTQVGEADVAKLRQGMSSYFTTLGSPGRRFYGQLRKIEPTPTVTNNVVLYNALFDVPNPNKVLMPQMTAQVFFVVAEARDVLAVPVAALTYPASAAPRAQAAAAAALDDVPARRLIPRRNRRARLRRAANCSADRPRGDRQRGVRREGSSRHQHRLRHAARSSKSPPQPTAQPLSSAKSTVGVASRVSAEILSGLNEGERIVVGVKVPEAPRTAAQTKGATPALSPPGATGAPVGAGGGFRR